MSSVRTYIFAWAGLVALLALTVLSSFLLSGLPSLAVSMLIAFAKAALVFWFFMHLSEEGGLIRLFAFAAGAWLLIMALLTATDYGTR
jgi:cytochrome c oxidase subunit 4